MKIEQYSEYTNYHSLNVHFKMVKMVNYMLLKFYIKFLKSKKSPGWHGSVN